MTTSHETSWRRSSGGCALAWACAIQHNSITVTVYLNGLNISQLGSGLYSIPKSNRPTVYIPVLNTMMKLNVLGGRPRRLNPCAISSH